MVFYQIWLIINYLYYISATFGKVKYQVLELDEWFKRNGPSFTKSAWDGLFTACHWDVYRHKKSGQVQCDYVKRL